VRDARQIARERSTVPENTYSLNIKRHAPPAGSILLSSFPPRSPSPPHPPASLQPGLAFYLNLAGNSVLRFYQPSSRTISRRLPPPAQMTCSGEGGREGGLTEKKSRRGSRMPGSARSMRHSKKGVGVPSQNTRLTRSSSGLLRRRPSPAHADVGTTTDNAVKRPTPPPERRAAERRRRRRRRRQRRPAGVGDCSVTIHRC